MANISPYDSRDIVEKYIYHKLLKTGYVWEFHPAEIEDDSPNNGLREVIDRRPRAPSGGEDPMCPFPDRLAQPDPHVRLNRILREAGDEIERMYQRDFVAMSDQLHFTPSTAQRKFTAVIEELFSDGVNWGRIVAFFEFGGTMCVESVNREMASQVDNIARWMTDYLNGPLKNWIQDNGGWDAFVEIYSQPRRTMFQPWPYLKTVFGLAALGAAWVTIGALFTQK
ncbi:apoptosis regulator Bcl-2a [Electrophorus electricus]|uniref:apoptosis regulator Bcl-2a n=1 Tax=Electrophorus electricus TaxID=8005 RepID=UPI000F09A9BE|nr:apoptosis regulator Bcl-2a [Electrophorus electricus]